MYDRFLSSPFLLCVWSVSSPMELLWFCSAEVPYRTCRKPEMAPGWVWAVWRRFNMRSCFNKVQLAAISLALWWLGRQRRWVRGCRCNSFINLLSSLEKALPVRTANRTEQATETSISHWLSLVWLSDSPATSSSSFLIQRIILLYFFFWINNTLLSLLMLLQNHPAVSSQRKLKLYPFIRLDLLLKHFKLSALFNSAFQMAAFRLQACVPN